MGAQTGDTVDPSKRQAIRRKQEDVLNQTGKASMFSNTEPESSPREGIEFGPGRSNRY